MGAKLDILGLMPTISRALARADQSEAYDALRSITERHDMPDGWAGRALLELARTEPRERLQSGLNGYERPYIPTAWRNGDYDGPVDRTWLTPPPPKRDPRADPVRDPTGPGGLSPRELQVVRMAACGLGMGATAEVLGTSVFTVQHQRKMALAKLDAYNVAHAIGILLKDAGLDIERAAWNLSAPPRTVECLIHAAEGLDQDDTASILGLSFATVQHYRKSLFAHLNARDIAHALGIMSRNAGRDPESERWPQE